MSRAHAEQLGIVIPTLNAGLTICATLQSLGAIVNAGASVLVIDGGSADDTLERVIGQGFSFLRNPGNMYEAINEGCARLATPWLTWLNGDDVLYGDSLCRRLNAAEYQDDVLYGTVDFIDSEGRFLHCWRCAPAGDLLRLYRSGYSPLLQQGAVFRRSVFERLGGFRSCYKFVADADFWWRALEAGSRFREMPGPPVAAFRVHRGQLSHVNARAMHEEHLRVVHAHGFHPTWRSGVASALRFRGRNIGNYLMRLGRRRLISGKWRLARSYDAPPVHCASDDSG